MIRRFAAFVAGVAVFSVSLFSQAQAAGAPTMAGDAITHLRSLGYDVCEPTLSQLPGELQEDGVLADAGPTPMFEVCEIRFATNVELEGLNWVAFHESCHLATMNDIHADPYHEQLEDPYHTHPLFSACLDHGPADRGGY